MQDGKPKPPVKESEKVEPEEKLYNEDPINLEILTSEN